MICVCVCLHVCLCICMMYIYTYYIHINICHIVLHRLEACIYHLLSNMASKKDEKTFKALMKNIKLLMPPESMKTCRRFFKARAKRWVRAIVQSNMHIDNPWERWGDTYDAIVMGQEAINEDNKAPGKTTDWCVTSIVLVDWYCSHCGVKLSQKHFTCTACGAPKTGADLVHWYGL